MKPLFYVLCVTDKERIKRETSLNEKKEVGGKLIMICD